MGKKSLLQTKYGKFVNPADQERKKERKKELKKNKKQRMASKESFIKSKNPKTILEEINRLEILEMQSIDLSLPVDKMYQERKKKLIETIEKILKFMKKDDPKKFEEINALKEEYEQKKHDAIQEYHKRKEVSINNLSESRFKPNEIKPYKPEIIDISSIPLPGCSSSSIKSEILENNFQEPTEEIEINAVEKHFQKIPSQFRFVPWIQTSNFPRSPPLPIPSRALPIEVPSYETTTPTYDPFNSVEANKHTENEDVPPGFEDAKMKNFNIPQTNTMNMSSVNNFGLISQPYFNNPINPFMYPQMNYYYGNGPTTSTFNYASTSVNDKNEHDQTEQTTTISAKPQIKNIQADVTRIVPLSVLRKEKTGQTNRPVQESKMNNTIENTQVSTKDNLYSNFMDELNNLL